MEIIYEISLGNDQEYNFFIDVEKGILNNKVNLAENPWIYQKELKCSVCTLSEGEKTICPAASAISTIIPKFKNNNSFENVFVRVKTQEREYCKECDLQTALNSLIGLILATSGCPVLSKLQYMTYSHLPFASFEESIVRTLGHYLIKQVFAMKNGEEPDFELTNLRKLYEDLKIVNTNLQKRILSACNCDANVNAINTFFSLSSLINYSLDENLKDIKYIFE